MNIPNVIASDKAQCRDCGWVYRPQRRSDFKNGPGNRSSWAARAHAATYGHHTVVKHSRRWTTEYGPHLAAVREEGRAPDMREENGND